MSYKVRAVRGPLIASLLSTLMTLTGLACSDSPAPPVAEPEPTTAPAPEPVPEPEPEEPFVEHTVAPGQTLWDISRTYEVPMARILEANEMTRRDARRLSKGRVLKIPGATEIQTEMRSRTVSLEDLPPIEDGAYHIVARGETLWDIATIYEKTVDEIMERNELDDAAVRALRAGSALVIPGIEQSQVAEFEPVERSARVRHTVDPGETIWDIARAFKVSTSEIMAANGMSRDDVQNLRAGSRLVIPGVERSGGRVRRRITKRQMRALSFARELGLGPRHVAQKLLRGEPERAWIEAAGGDPNRLPGTLRWPVSNGRFVRGYGSGEGGYHLAVDIIGEIGWNVRAAAPGIVGYSGDEVSGYGNLVILIHQGGWITVYAHNSANFVVAGERVPRNGVIAEVGSTGRSRGPHVHFEFIYDQRNCDPVTLFRPGVRHKTRMAFYEKRSWTDPRQRPEEVNCARRRRHPRSRSVLEETLSEN